MSREELDKFVKETVGPITKIPRVELVHIDIPKLDDKNPNAMSDKQFDALVKNIERYGFLTPIITNKDYLVADGEHRLRAARHLGFSEIPVIALQVSEVDRRILRQVMNKLHGEHDSEMDQEEFKFLLKENAFGEFQELLGGTDKLLVQFLASVEKEGLKEDNLDLDKALKNTKYQVKPGEIWQMGQHKLMCGDCTSNKDVKKLFGEEKAKLCFSSPPYNMNAKMYENYGDNLNSEKFVNFNLNAIKEIEPFLEGFLMWNLSYNKNAKFEFMEIFLKIVKDTKFNFLEMIVWDKKHGMPITSNKNLTRQYEDILVTADPDTIQNDLDLMFLGEKETKTWFNKKTMRGITNLWRIGTNNTQIENLKACFPVELPKKGIILTTQQEDIVTDIFGGSGTTLIACEQLNRKCLMMEIDAVYCSVIIERWENVTGLKAQKVN